LEALDSTRYARFVRRFGSMLRSRSGTRSAAALAVAPDLVEQRHAALAKAMKRIDADAPASAYHRLRIACKRFRYALEFLGDVYPDAASRLVKRTVALQDVLGAYQDGDVAIARLRDLATARSDELGPETIFAMGEIAERYRSSMAEARGRVARTYKPLGGKPWKQFRKQMEAARPA
jgi:CHAD domain-containing protein